MYVIDASVHVADIRPREPNHETARAFLRRINSERFPVFLPAIVLPEIAAAISRGTGKPALGRRLVALVRRIPNVTIIPIDEELGQSAADLAARYALRGCDAV